MDRNAREIINNDGLIRVNENTGNIKNNGPVDGDGSNGHIEVNYGIVENNNGIMTDKLTGAQSWIKVTANPDRTVTSNIPQNNSLMTLILL